jgi:mannan endo-1,4-beta-mannosidase
MRLSILAALAGIGAILIGGASSAAPARIHLFGSDARMFDTSVSTAMPGYTGKGYATGFEASDAHVVWTIDNAVAGIYDVTIRYSAPGQKGYDLVVNGAKYSCMFPTSPNGFSTASAGEVELAAGSNTIEIDRGWGYYDIDSIDFTMAPAPAPLRMPSAVPCDPKATAAARALLKYLVGQYGKRTLSGQHEIKDSDYIKQTTGKAPAIVETDLIDYSPTRIQFGANPGRTAEDAVAAGKAGQIVGLMWHWNAPADLINKTYVDANGNKVDALWWSGFYTKSTTFDVAKALADPNSNDYQLLLRDMDVIAVQLKKFSDAGIPVLWRPLHEADGGWFWWGAKGPDAFKKLWILMYERMTVTHNLHNLIWVDCSSTDPAWYPGDKYVDIVAVDAYPSDPSDPLVTQWDTLQKEYGDRKLLAISEFGGVPDVERMRKFGVRWDYWVSWSGMVGADKVPVDKLDRLYTAPNVITEDKLPNIGIR